MNEPTEDARTRIFVYGDHRFDDPGNEYTVEQVKNHLLTYFPELSHATTEEKTLPDGTVEVIFRKQVARKGSTDAGRLAQLLDELEVVAPYEDPLAELTATLGEEGLTLAAVLDARDTLQAHADQVFGLATRTSQLVNKCLILSPSPTRGALLGF